MSINNNPAEYAKTCNISLELAEKRCNHYKRLSDAAKQVSCPKCNEKDCLYADISHINCKKCDETFDFEDTHFEDYVRYLSDFDEVLALSTNDTFDCQNEKELGTTWEKYVQRSTEQLN